jgi:hypothetical protein
VVAVFLMGQNIAAARGCTRKLAASFGAVRIAEKRRRRFTAAATTLTLAQYRDRYPPERLLAEGNNSCAHLRE